MVIKYDNITNNIRREVKELNAKVDAIALNLELVKRDAEVTKEAILHQLFEFQSHTQANHIILTTQLGQLVEDLNRGGNDKKGEGVSSRGPQPSRARVLVRVERRPLPTREPSPDAQSSGQYLSAEQAAEFVSEMDRQEFDRLERERRERRQSSSSSFKRRRRY
ncbi:lysine-specific histone demethylase 13 [Dorcoceras hygrometricum]|uniref:Lysine-specific histone demethylase 13 n=1 Tax=Dorcoceras hygrometricum TaxID=472368 RepID=A0A2Z7D0G6_9LAMI|nr:lysine-specific histone demethylase 13 [Dorcoceras hygrometricum]